MHDRQILFIQYDIRPRLHRCPRESYHDNIPKRVVADGARFPIECGDLQLRVGAHVEHSQCVVLPHRQKLELAGMRRHTAELAVRVAYSDRSAAQIRSVDGGDLVYVRSLGAHEDAGAICRHAQTAHAGVDAVVGHVEGEARLERGRPHANPFVLAATQQSVRAGVERVHRAVVGLDTANAVDVHPQQQQPRRRARHQVLRLEDGR
mmetsp:Transcript_21588/g.36150  ORF Transcript_21588/g.36150 Transcript_21588/m.36150 type:complete len:206 (+) Transcript_21588:2844-3461(+)